MTDKDQDKDPEIYNPEIKKEKTIDIDGTEYESNLDSVMDKDGFIKTKLNQEVIIQRISHDLYKDSDSGLRELYNNEVRACQIARDNFKTDPYIKVSLNTLDRKLVIQGFNSLGITEKIFTKVLLVLGNSGNLNAKAIGQFGMGFASYTTLSDVMMLETKCIEKNSKGLIDQYSVMAKGGLGFQKMPKNHLDKTGTKLSLTLREKTDYDSLISMLESLSNTSGVKTYLELNTKDNKKISGYGSGIHELKQTSFESMFDELNNNAKLSYIKTSLINEDIEIYLSISADKNGYINDNRNKKIFLCNSPITAKLDRSDHGYSDNYKDSAIDKINYSSLVVNLKDERKFKPMPERERLTKEAEQSLNKIIIDLYNNAIKKGVKPCHTIDQWLGHEHRNFIVNNDDYITKNFDEKTRELSKVLNIDVFEHEPTQRKTKYDHKELKHILPDHKTEYKFYLEKRDKRISGLLDENRSNHCLVVCSDKHRPYKDNEDKFKEAIKQLKNAGFIEAKQYLIDHNIKAKRSTRYNKIEKTYDEISIHKTLRSDNWYDRNTLKDDITTINIKSDEFNDLKKDVIMVKPFGDYRQLLKEIQSDYYLTVEKNDLNCGLKTISDIQKELSKLTFNSNHGKITLDQILNDKTKSLNVELNTNYHNSHDPKTRNEIDIKNQLKAINLIPKADKYHKKIIHIVEPNNILFKLALVLTKNGIKNQKHSMTLDYYYKDQVEKRAKNIKLHNDNYDNKLDSHNFNNIFDFEEYLNTLVKLENINPTLIKLFQLSKDSSNYKELSNDVLRLNEKCS